MSEYEFDVENYYPNEQDESSGESYIQQTLTRSGISKGHLPTKLIFLISFYLSGKYCKILKLDVRVRIRVRIRVRS